MKFLIMVKEDIVKQVDSIEEASCMQYLNGYYKLLEVDSLFNSTKTIKIPKLRLVKKEEAEEEED